MKLHRTILLMTVAFAFVAILTSSATAQLVVRDATFTLPTHANWVGRILPPGDYTLTVSRLSGGRGVLYRVEFARGGKRTSLLAESVPGPEAGDKSMLVCDSIGSIYNVRALHLAKANLVLTFPVLNATLAGTQIVKGTKTVPVEASGQ